MDAVANLDRRIILPMGLPLRRRQGLYCTKKCFVSLFLFVLRPSSVAALGSRRHGDVHRADKQKQLQKNEYVKRHVYTQ